MLTIVRPNNTQKKIVRKEINMALQECGNGHIYDTDQYSSCPYCSGVGNRINFINDETSAVAPVPPANEVGRTVAPQSYIERQTPPVIQRQPQPVDPGVVGKTVGVLQQRIDIEPVVGWLVCIEGADKGHDYRIYGKNNTIGRSDRNDIIIKGDRTISRDNHAKLAYDAKHNAFHLIPADSTNTIYLNDEPVYIPTKLSARDIIEFGECKFMFVPFCDDSFRWDNDKKKDE